MEVVCGSPDTRLKFEDMDEKSDDNDTQTAQERESTGEGTANAC